MDKFWSGLPVPRKYVQAYDCWSGRRIFDLPRWKSYHQSCSGTNDVSFFFWKKIFEIFFLKTILFFFISTAKNVFPGKFIKFATFCAKNRRKQSENKEVADFRNISNSPKFSSYSNPVSFVPKSINLIFLDSARFQLSEKYNHAYILKILNFGVRDAECLVSLRSNLLTKTTVIRSGSILFL